VRASGSRQDAGSGRNPSLREATDLASTVGWTSGQGMAGIASEQKLMDKMGIPTKLIGADVAAIAREAQTGNPVTISTQGHYFTADGYNPETGAFHVGQSGMDLKGGSEWMTAEQMSARMGPIQGALLADNPQVPAPSTADMDTNPVSYLGRVKDSALDAIKSKASDLSTAVSQVDPLSGLTDQQQQIQDQLDAAGSTASAASPCREASALARNGPIGATRDVVNQVAQGANTGLVELGTEFQKGRRDLGGYFANAAANTGDVPLLSGVAQQGLGLAAATSAGETPLDVFDTIAELTKKYPVSGKLSGILPSLDDMTPEDRQRYSEAMRIVGSLEQPEVGAVERGAARPTVQCRSWWIARVTR
jgi:hypothetical protein